MLVLSDTDRFRIDLNELRQRILQAAGDRNRASKRNVIVRELFGSELGRGVDARAGLGNDDVGNRRQAKLTSHRIVFFQSLGEELFGFAGSGSVAKRDELDLVFAHHALDLAAGFRHTDCAGGRVDHAGRKHLSGRIDNCELASGSEGRVKAKDGLAGDRLRHQKLLQVLLKDLDCLILRFFSQIRANFIFNRRSNETLVRIHTDRL